MRASNTDILPEIVFSNVSREIDKYVSIGSSDSSVSEVKTIKGESPDSARESKESPVLKIHPLRMLLRLGVPNMTSSKMRP